MLLVLITCIVTNEKIGTGYVIARFIAIKNVYHFVSSSTVTVAVTSDQNHPSHSVICGYSQVVIHINSQTGDLTLYEN